MGTLTETKTDKTFEVKKKVNYNDVANLLCSALEGGSNYWYMLEKVVKPKKEDRYIFIDSKGKEDTSWSETYTAPFSKGGRLVISDYSGENAFEPKILDLDAIERGLSVMAEKYPMHFSDFISDNGDAITGDVFLQCCLFGETIFG